MASLSPQPVLDYGDEPLSARVQRRQPPAAFAADPVGRGTEVEGGDGGAGAPGFGQGEALGLGNDRREDDEADAVPRKQRMKRPAAVVAVDDDVRLRAERL